MTKSEQAEMERAGYLESNGKTGRTVETGLLAVPRWARIERACIHWKGFSFGSVKPSPETFDNFLGLWRADDLAILTFAKSWGTLRRPLWLSQRRYKTDLEAREPLPRWRNLSRHAWELLAISAKLRSEEKMTFEQWTELMNEERILSGLGRVLALGTREQRQKIRTAIVKNNPALAYDDGPEEWAREAKTYLDAEIAAWNTKLGPVSFGITRDDDAPAGWQAVFDFGGSLPCYIGFQLMLIVSGGDAFTCSACGKPYIRPRGRSGPKGLRKAPKVGERNYCGSKECLRERNRLAAERRPERMAKREQRRKDRDE